MFPFILPTHMAPQASGKLDSEAGGQRSLCQEAKHQCLEEPMIDAQCPPHQSERESGWEYFLPSQG